MVSFLNFESVSLPDGALELRRLVRTFLEEARAKGTYTPQCDSWLSGFSPEFSQELGRREWVGMTWPSRYGGHERSSLERYVVIEELLAAGAPVAAHWIADRQMGPMILKFGTEAQRQRFLPDIALGNSYWAIGMSEANAGSDLAAVSTRLVPDGSAWRLEGHKLWSSGAHHCHYMMVLCRVGQAMENRRLGLCNVIVDLRDPGVTIRPIRLLTGEHHFNEVTFDGVKISADRMLGNPDDGWRQVTSELAYERSGPERFLSTFPLLTALTEWTKVTGNQELATEIAELFSEAWGLRRMSLSVAKMLDQGRDPTLEAALIKDMGTRLERRITAVAERYVPDEPSLDGTMLSRLTAQAIMHGPGFTIRGGTSEILRTIVAKGLELS